METSSKMIWIFFILGSAVADKLDKGYLPPPGSNFSGGSPGIIELPFEYPKSEYNLKDEFSKPSTVAIGIDRVGSLYHPKISSKSITLIPNEDYSTMHPIGSNHQESDLNSPQNLSDSLKPQKHQDKINDQVFNLSSNLRSSSSPSFNDLLTGQYEPEQQGQYFSASTPRLGNNLKYPTTANPHRIQDEADRKAIIINYDNVIAPEGYAYSYDTSNKIHADESAETLNGVKAKGSYSYWGDDGKLYNVSYTADENGFLPQGDHLPTPPPIPDAILKVIEQAYKDKEAGIFDDGSYDDRKYGYKNYLTGTKSRNIYDLTENRISPDKKYDLNQIPIIHDNYIDGFENLKNKKTSSSSSNNHQRPNEHQISKNKENEGFDYFQPQKDTAHNLDTEVEIKNKTYIPHNNNMNDAFYPKEQYTDIRPEIKNGNNQIENFEMSSGHNTGYQYNRPQNQPQELTTRISDSTNINTGKIKQMNKATRKPFQTPNVNLTDDNMKEYNFNEGTIDDLQSSYDDNNNNHYNNFDYVSDPNMNDDVKDPEDKDIFDDFLVSDKKGYSYGPEVFDTNKDMKELFTNNIISRDPSEFTTRFNNIQIDDSRISDTLTTTEKNTVPTSLYVPNVNKKLNNLIGTTTSRTSIVGESRGNVLPSEEDMNIGYSKNATKSDTTIPKLMLSTLIPKIGASYAPYIDILDTNKQDTKEDIGEDFSGPKQPQRFDSASGYYYK